MKKTMKLTESEIAEINMINEKVHNGGMSTEEMIKQFNAVPFKQFQNEMHEKIMNYDK